MTKFDLTYNPFTKEKSFLVNGEKDDFCDCWGTGNKELSEWANIFFEKLYKIYNDSEMEVSFKGIIRDYEFLEDAKLAYEKKNTSVKISLIDNGCSNTTEKLGKLKELFEKMQKETPFEQLRTEELKQLFERIVSSDFEMAVVATMSSGKSTLINAMLGRELLPARNEATTATLAKIHDIDGANNFTGKSFDKDHKELVSCNPLTLENMNTLNNNPETSVIEIYGDILGIESKDLQLVLTDTPGPNNSRTDEHKEHTYSLLTADYKPMILYVLNGTQLETNDDNSLLNDVAKAMNSGGRQAQERFIFVLNKADQFDPATGEDVPKKIEDVKDYLEKHNIHNARVFPAAARMAKVIRQYQNNQTITETEKDEILPNYAIFIKREWKHFSNYSPLSPASKRLQDEMIASAKGKNDKYQEALIYTGIPAIELAISEYLMKYALPTKITEGVYSFKEKIDNLGVEAAEKEKLKGNLDAVKQLSENLKIIEDVLRKGDKADAVRRKIDELSIQSNLQKYFEKVSSNLMSQFTQRTQKMQNSKIHKETAEAYIDSLKVFLPELETKFRVDLQNSLNDVIKIQAQEAVEEHKKYLEDLIGSVSYDISPAAILGDLASRISVDSTLDSYSQYSHMEDIKVGSHQVLNEDKKWYKPWTWFDAKYYTVDDYKKQEFVDFSKYLEKKILPMIENSVETTRKTAFDWAIEEEKKFKKFFKEQLVKLDEAIRGKLSEKKKTLEDKCRFEESIKENERNLRWISSFKKELDSLLSI
ncbi:MAG: dynamin family protein [Spirochaetales bacterium]|nr:dynamin family protein [Spirochaetales bacterium]